MKYKYELLTCIQLIKHNQIFSIFYNWKLIVYLIKSCFLIKVVKVYMKIVYHLLKVKRFWNLKGKTLERDNGEKYMQRNIYENYEIKKRY